MSALRHCLSRVVSLKALLIVSFILLMAIAGILGFTLTYIQGQSSLNQVAETSMNEAAYSVVVSLQSKITTGHQMNRMESLYFLRSNLTLDNWVNAYYIWRPITLQNMASTPGTFATSMAYWLVNNSKIFWFPMEYISLSTATITLANFNTSICDELVSFPGSNCSVPEFEIYPFDPATMQPFWKSPIALQSMEGGGDAPISFSLCTNRKIQQFHPGYTAVYATPTISTQLILQVNVEILNPAGACIGAIGKDLSLDFVNTILLQLVASNPLLAEGGRAMVYESQGFGLIGASHGAIYVRKSCVTCLFGAAYDRLRPNESTDGVIAAAGATLVRNIAGGAPKFRFDVGSGADRQQYLHIGAVLSDDIGLSWVVSVVLSLTELFKDINTAAMRMLGYTVVAIVALSVLASLLITYVVVYPLRQLSRAMEDVAEMNLEEADKQHTRSRFHEITLMQGYFLDMVERLKEYRAFLPEGILYENAPVEVGAAGVTEKAEVMKSNQPSSSNLKDIPSIAHPTSPSHFHIPASARSGRTPSVVNSIAVMTRRLVSCLYIDVTGFHSLFRNMDVLIQLHSELLETYTRIVQEYHGLCNPMIGDKFVAVWNVKAMKSEHAVFCASAAYDIYKSVANLQKQYEYSSLEGIRIACTSGEGQFGPMGTKTTRSFTIISQSISRGFGFQKLLKFLPINGVVCDSTIQQRITFKFFTRLVAVLPGVRDSVYEILQVVEGNPDEWMYELQQKESKQQQYVAFELGVKGLFLEQAEFPKVKEYFDTYLSNNATSSDTLAKWYLENITKLPRFFDSEYGFLLPMSCIYQGNLEATFVTAGNSSKNQESARNAVVQQPANIPSEVQPTDL